MQKFSASWFFSFLNCYKNLMKFFKKKGKKKKRKRDKQKPKPSIKRSGGTEKQELPKPIFSYLLNGKTLRRPNYNLEYLRKKKKKSSTRARTCLLRQIKNSLFCTLWRRKALTVLTISLPLSMCLLGRPLLPILHGSCWSNTAEVAARCGYRLVAEISVSVMTMAQIKGEIIFSLSPLEETLLTFYWRIFIEYLYLNTFT